MEWMILPFKRYAQFSGRSRRMEYWMFTLLTVVVYAIGASMMLAGGFNFSALDESGDPGTPGPLFWLGAVIIGIFLVAALVPSIAVTIRRLHDRNMSGWWYLGFIALGLIPYVGFIASIALLVILFLPGTPGANRFGEDPKDPTSASVFE